MARQRKNRIGSRNKHVHFAIVLTAFALLLGGGAYFLTSILGHAFEGPSQSAGTGGGVIRSEGPNISVGTSSSPGSSRFFLVASSTLASDYAVRMVQPDGTVIFLVRNDQKVSIATSTPSGSTSTLIVAGNALITGNLTAAGTYGQFSGTVNAINVSAGSFGNQTGGGNYAFPASLSIATSTIPTGGVLFVNGNVGIGTSTPEDALHVHANTSGLRITRSDVTSTVRILPSSGTGIFQTDGSFRISPLGTATSLFEVTQSGRVGIGTTTPSTALHVIGDVTANAYYYSSDVNLKYDIRPTSGLAGISSLRGVEFKWIDSGEPGLGLIAQEVENKYPSAVRTDASGMKTVNYGALVAPLIESVKELNAKIEKQNSKILELEHEIQTLRLD